MCSFMKQTIGTHSNIINFVGEECAKVWKMVLDHRVLGLPEGRPPNWKCVLVGCIGGMLYMFVWFMRNQTITNNYRISHGNRTRKRFSHPPSPTLKL